MLDLPYRSSSGHLRRCGKVSTLTIRFGSAVMLLQYCYHTYNIDSRLTENLVFLSVATLSMVRDNELLLH